MDVYSLKVVDIVALTAVVLSLMCPASKSGHTHIAISSPSCVPRAAQTSARRGGQCVSESVREAQAYPSTLPSGDAVSRSLEQVPSRSGHR